MKKWISILACVFGLFTWSFTSKPGFQKFDKTGKASNAKAADLNPNLYPLYVSNADFRLIVSYIHDVLITDHRKKVVFQFIYTDNVFKLALYSENRIQSGFDESQNFILEACTTCKVEAVIDNGVYMGDLEIANQKDNYNHLKKLADDSKNQFFVFVPEIDDKTIKNKKVVKYTLFTSSQPITKATLKLALVPTGVVTNPSPPRKGN